MCVKRKLFRYRSFDNEIVNDYSYIHQRMVNVEKWKFEAFEGLVYPSSPLYFNDPYDCEFCFQADTIDELLDRKEYIQLLENRFQLKKEEKNRILYSDDIEKAIKPDDQQYDLIKKKNVELLKVIIGRKMELLRPKSIDGN